MDTLHKILLGLGIFALLAILFTASGRELLKQTLAAFFKILLLPFTLLSQLAESIERRKPRVPSDPPEPVEILTTFFGLLAVAGNIFLLCYGLGTVVGSLSTYAVVAVAVLFCLLEILSGILITESFKRNLPLPFKILGFVVLTAFSISEALLAWERTRLVTDSVAAQVSMALISFVTPWVCALALTFLPKVLAYSGGYALYGTYTGAGLVCGGLGTTGDKAIIHIEAFSMEVIKVSTHGFDEAEKTVKWVLDRWKKPPSNLLPLIIIGILSLGQAGCKIKLPQEQPAPREIHVCLDTSRSFAFCEDSVHKTRQVIQNLSCGDILTIHKIHNRGFNPTTFVTRGKIPCPENAFNLNDRNLEKAKKKLLQDVGKKVSCQEGEKSVGTTLFSGIVYVALLLNQSKTPAEHRYVIYFTDLGSTEQADAMQEVLPKKLPPAHYVAMNFLCLDGPRSAVCTKQRKAYWEGWFKERGVRLLVLLPEQSNVDEILPRKKQNTFL